MVLAAGGNDLMRLAGGRATWISRAGAVRCLPTAPSELHDARQVNHKITPSIAPDIQASRVFFPAYIFKTITEALKLSYYPHLPVTRIPAGSRPEITVDEKPQPSRPGLPQADPSGTPMQYPWRNAVTTQSPSWLAMP